MADEQNNNPAPLSGNNNPAHDPLPIGGQAPRPSAPAPKPPQAEEQPKEVPHSPPPPPPIRPRGGEYSIRTMESDLKTAPKEVLPQSDREGPAPAEASTTIQMKSPVVAEEAPSKKNLYWIIGGVVLALALVAVGYFVVYPMLVDNGTDTSTPTTGSTPPDTTPPITMATPAHQSYFLTSPVRVSEMTLAPISLPNIAFGLQSISLQPLASGSTEEVLVIGGQENQIPFATYITQLLPDVDSNKLSDLLEDDFTAFIYYDNNGYWPGYVAKLKTGASIDDLKAEITKLESTDLESLFITPPGTISAFKDGLAANSSYATRYAVGSTSGSALNYGYFGDYLIISTSYDGLTASLNLTGVIGLME
ncbi:MAG: hypothetical protein Q8O87_02865 [bacterium]|nr:hypothetical protein [bacterium]